MSLRFGKAFLTKGTDGGKLLNLLDDSRLRRSLELRIHGKREDFHSDFFGDREVTFFETKAFIGLLQMKRNRIVNTGIDLGIGEMLLQSIAIGHADDVEVMDRTRPCRAVRNDYTVRRRQQLVVTGSSLLALLVPIH